MDPDWVYVCMYMYVHGIHVEFVSSRDKFSPIDFLPHGLNLGFWLFMIKYKK
jgi:hypothetical protein